MIFKSPAKKSRKSAVRSALRVCGAGILAVGLVAGLGQAPVQGATKYKLLWSQEFTGKKGTRIDQKYWNYEMMVGGNNEKEYYTMLSKNSQFDGLGHFVITARVITERDPLYNYCMPDVVDNCWYTSARLNTSSKISFQYGKMSARIKMPAGAGVWPAFWMLGQSLNEGETWPTCGEIDIVEAKDNPNSMVFGTAHGPGYSGGQGWGNVFYSNAPLSDAYHTYSIEWKKNRVDWYFDGQLYHTMTPASVYGNQYVFNQKFFLIMNLAMGGMFTGNMDPVNVPTASMSIDWIRYYSVNGVGKVYKN